MAKPCKPELLGLTHARLRGSHHRSHALEAAAAVLGVSRRGVWCWRRRRRRRSTWQFFVFASRFTTVVNGCDWLAHGFFSYSGSFSRSFLRIQSLLCSAIVHNIPSNDYAARFSRRALPQLATAMAKCRVDSLFFLFSVTDYYLMKRDSPHVTQEKAAKSPPRYAAPRHQRLTTLDVYSRNPWSTVAAGALQTAGCHFGLQIEHSVFLSRACSTDYAPTHLLQQTVLFGPRRCCGASVAASAVALTGSTRFGRPCRVITTLI